MQCTQPHTYISRTYSIHVVINSLRPTHICVIKLTVIGSDNGLSPEWRQAIIWTNAGILLIGPLGTNFNEISIKIHTFSFKKTPLKTSSGERRPFCLGLNVLTKDISFCYRPGHHHPVNMPWYTRIKLVFFFSTCTGYTSVPLLSVEEI